MIYARYSSEEQRPESIADQIRKCRGYCDQRNWAVVGTYSDAAISGATNQRPEYQRLLKDVERGIFDVVVVEAVDRLSRRLADVATFHDVISHRKIELHSADQGPVNEMMAGFQGIMAQAYLKDLKAKTKRGLTGKVLAGLSAGSIGYGYKVDPTEKGKRTIDPDEAAVVRRIFRDYANGASPLALATTLNREGVPGPRGAAWIDTTIRGQVARGTGLLNNELYVGRIVWNRCTYERPPGAEKRLARPNPKEDWEISTDESLRIVDDELWDRVKAKQNEVRTEIRRNENGVALNRAHRAEHLLSGLIVCGECGEPFAMRDARHYGCSNYRSKGTCKNKLKVKRADLERAVGDAIRHRWINEDAIIHVRAEAIRERELALAELGDAGAKIKQSLKNLEIQQNRIVDAIAAGGHTDKLLERLAQLGAQAQELKDELAALDVAVVPDPAEISAKIEAKIREVAAGIEGLLSKASGPNLLEFRNIVRGMIERITVSRHESGAAEISVRGQFAGVMQAAGLVEKYALKTKTPPEPEATEGDLSVVAGAGFEPSAFTVLALAIGLPTRGATTSVRSIAFSVLCSFPVRSLPRSGAPTLPARGAAHRACYSRRASSGWGQQDLVSPDAPPPQRHLLPVVQLSRYAG